MESCCQEKGSITDIASASALTKTSETSAGTASFAEGSAQGIARVQYKSDINADPSSMNTIRRTERKSQANISGWIVRNRKKQTVSHNAETAERDRVKNKETSDYTRKYATPLARSSSVFGDFKKAESGPVQGATVNRRLVEPTNSASVDTIHSNLGIVKKILRLLYAERKRES